MFSEHLISEYLLASVEQFQQDCSQLCAQHYPTVHNRGMRENHLGKALCRRIMVTLQQAGITTGFAQHKNEDQISQPIFTITTANFSIAVVAHRLLSANRACRQGLVNAIALAQSDLDPQLPAYIVIVADHWFDRSKASKEIPAWWLGQLPENINDYAADGIKLLASQDKLADQLNREYQLSGGKFYIHHPLKRESSHKIVHKYLLLSAFLPFYQ